jgi:hypothetical protein
VIALTYGRDVDWVKNVLAASGCRLIHRGNTVDMVGPTIVPLRSDTPAIPGWLRGILRSLGVDEVLRLQVPPDSARGGGDDRFAPPR